MRQLLVLCSPEPTADDRRLLLLGEFLGLQPVAVTSPSDADPAGPPPVSLVATAASLKQFLRQPSSAVWFHRRLSVGGSTAFITGLTSAPADLEMLETLVPGTVQGVRRPSPASAKYRIAADAPGMPQLRSLEFGPIDSAADFVFEIRDSIRATTVIEIDGAPCYIRLDRPQGSWHLLACAEVLDLDAPPPAGRHPIDQFLRFVPLLAFLRANFGEHCWHNDRPAACLVIDDPLLKSRYGFLEFSRLEAAMARSRFSTNIAFIPWNYRRTNRQVATRFKQSDRRLSISVHGCDHTEAEFGSTDEGWLRSQARRAMWRMNRHERLTGIRHDRVMVFPQGVFSRRSLRALEAEGFAAAVNSTLHPVDGAPGDISNRDMLDVACRRLGGVPLFLRHYPDRLEKVALDLFLGKQALLVEHHGFFRQGYEAAARCADFVNRCEPLVRWTDLDDLCSTAAVGRVDQRGRCVQAFGSRVHLENSSEEPVRYRVWNRWAGHGVESAKWRGRRVEVEFDVDAARCEVVVAPGERGVLEFERTQVDSEFEERAPTLKRRLVVFARRHLSEVRDTHFSRSATLIKLARQGKQLLPRL